MAVEKFFADRLLAQTKKIIKLKLSISNNISIKIVYLLKMFVNISFIFFKFT